MEEFLGFLIVIMLGLMGSGPIAVILIIVLFKKLGKLERRIDRIEGKTAATPTMSQYVPLPKPDEIFGSKPAYEPKKQEVVRPQELVTEPKQPAEPERLKQEEKTVPSFHIEPTIEASAEKPSTIKPAVTTESATGAMAPLPYFENVKKEKSPSQGGLELKIGTRVLLVAGIILIIFAVAWFLKLVYEKGLIPPWGRIALVAASGVVAVIVGDVLRRKKFEIVAKGIAALGFALLYGAVFGANNYRLFGPELIFVFSIIVTALALSYAAVLNEIFIAFLSLLGGYLAPLIILKGQNLPVPLFSYVLALSAGAMGCAMFRRWRAVNWIAMVGTWLLYTAWFEKFYTDDQTKVALIWLSVFACLYLVMPILYGLIRRVEARSEDVTLVVINSIIAFYHLWQILGGDRPQMAVGTALLGAVHLCAMFAALWRYRNDKSLRVSLGVIGIAFITAAIPMYFELNAALVGWSIEAVILTFIGIRYQSLWTQAMAIAAAVLSAAGLFYNLPLHDGGDFRVFLNGPFGTWVIVAAGMFACHLLWRFMKQAESNESSVVSQIFYTAGALLLAVGFAFEWYAHCRWHMVYETVGQSLFLKGMMVTAILLILAFFVRPVSPRGEAVRFAGITAAIFGCVFFAISMMGVYNGTFKLFVNVPFGLAMCFLGAIFWAAWRFKEDGQNTEAAKQAPSAFTLLGIVLFFVILTEQMYLYWSCRNEYGGYEGDWRSKVLQYTFIAWAVYGLVLLAAGINFKKSFVKTTAFVVSALSAAGLFFLLPLHRSVDFRLIYNAPFITWAIVCAAMIIGHCLWRFMSNADKGSKWICQLYYTAGLLVFAVGAGFEWAQHCHWHIEPAARALSHLHLGLIIIAAFMVQGLLARPLAPAGGLVKGAGIIMSLGSCVYIAFAFMEVYYSAFKLLFNWPFAIVLMFVMSVLAAAWIISKRAKEKGRTAAAVMVLSSLVLLWIVLSEQVHYYWYCRNQYGPVELPNWSFSAQMYMSVSWAVYAAILMVIGFIARAASVRWLSLLIFTVLLLKIFIIDTSTLRTEYRIAAFVTTGLILVGVSFLYQLLKNKGFFNALERQPE